MEESIVTANVHYEEVLRADNAAAEQLEEELTTAYNEETILG